MTIYLRLFTTGSHFLLHPTRRFSCFVQIKS